MTDGPRRVRLAHPGQKERDAIINLAAAKAREGSRARVCYALNDAHTSVDAATTRSRRRSPRSGSSSCVAASAESDIARTIDRWASDRESNWPESGGTRTFGVMDLGSSSQNRTPVAVTIGSFDGVHGPPSPDPGREKPRRPGRKVVAVVLSAPDVEVALKRHQPV